ncbi:hypothetical protein [Stenotrophomonas sp.]|uniref:hypothetical protein n=1 Tax=Stenotrophomonas sp. TaxID=69392 RepID=UPI0028AC6065|nr:hypothetical protein [Stenotrophomonas sp.]
MTNPNAEACKQAAVKEPAAFRIDGPTVDGSTFTQFVTDIEFANILRQAGIEITVTPLYAAPVAAAPVDGLHLAVIGRAHFGNPIPQEWYAAARELLASTPAAPGIDLFGIRSFITELETEAMSAATSDNVLCQKSAAIKQRIVERLRPLIDASPKGGDVQDDRFPNGLADAITYADSMEDAAADLYQQVFGYETDGSETGADMLRTVLRELQDSPKGGSDVEVMQLRYQLNSLRQLLSGFDIAVQNNPLQPPCTYLEEVRLSHEFQPGEGQKVAAALRNALNSNSEGAKP